MVASGEHATTTSGSLGGVQALHEVKRAEEQVRELRAQAEEAAEATIEQGRAEAKAILEQARQDAAEKAEAILQAALKQAQHEADRIVATAKAEASELRDVPDDRLDTAAAEVLDRFRSRIGGA